MTIGRETICILVRLNADDLAERHKAQVDGNALLRLIMLKVSRRAFLQPVC